MAELGSLPDHVVLAHNTQECDNHISACENQGASLETASCEEFIAMDLFKNK